ncbi:MAG: hypothetical protein Q9M26_07730 [Mariprofundales bacterium]|nr:hypothetical protein [Mariprofundales bacterium]
MSEKITRNIAFKSQSSGAITPAEMRIIAYSSQERTMRAVKSLVGMWLIAAACVVIPIAHIILVPTFFIAGIVIASRKKKMAEEGRDASGSCPACQNDICINLSKEAGLPQWHHCPECSDSLELREAVEQ